MEKKEYLVIKQTIKKPDGWSDSDVKIFIDNYLKLIETYGKDYLQVGGSWEVKSEEGMDNENKS